MNLRDKLNRDHYTTKLPHGTKGSTERDAHRADQQRLEMEFQADLIDTYETHVLPDAVQTALFDKAWSDGHASGYHEVAYHYEELATLVLMTFEAGTKHKV